MAEDSLKELEIKRDAENKIADEHKAKRDQLNSEAKHWINERNALTVELNKLIDEASSYKSERDKLNEQVKIAKAERSKWHELSLQYEEELINKKSEIQPKAGVPMWKMKKELKELEFKQMTSVLTPDKEKALIAAISKLQSEIKDAEAKIYSDPAIVEIANKLKNAKNETEAAHKNVNTVANLAQEYHEKMIKIFDSVDELRKKINEAQEKFIAAKLKADEEHRMHIEHIENIRNIDKMINAMKNKEKGKDAVSIDDVMQKLLRGEKVSTEDLLTAQKVGKN